MEGAAPARIPRGLSVDRAPGREALGLKLKWKIFFLKQLQRAFLFYFKAILELLLFYKMIKREKKFTSVATFNLKTT